MLQVTVDGQSALSNLGQIKTMGELVELIKASIDPDKMITRMLLDSRELSEEDWRRSLTSMQDGKLEVITDERVKYLMERISQSPAYLKQIVDKFTESRGLYQSGNSFKANQEFKVAVQDLSAYMNWYLTLLSLDRKVDHDFIDRVTEHIEQIGRVCEKIISYMLYNSWWAVGETLEAELEPQLGKLYNSASHFSAEVAKANSIAVKCPVAQ